MRLFRLCVAVAALGLLVHPAQAHFVWVLLKTGTKGKTTAHVYFSESATPGEGHLVDRIAHAKVLYRVEGGKPTLVKAKAVVNGKRGELLGAIESTKPGCLEVTCKYGVFQRGEKSFLLHYYAKCLDFPRQVKGFGRSHGLPLEVVPHQKNKDIELQVLWQGKPAKGTQVVAVDPKGKELELKADKAGRFQLASVQPGLYAIRARLALDKPGKEGDKTYKQELHYSTLALRVSSDSAGGVSAAGLLFKARDARVIWKDFPGLQADLRLNEDGRAQRGRITVSEDGEVSLSGLKLAKDSRVEQTLNSMVMHRLSNSGFQDNVSFADKQTDHPLGRLIRLDYDSRMASAYRVKGDVICEVNRTMKAGRFTISVLNVHRNSEGKYLPGTYTVSFWNKDGSLRSTSTVRETWVRVGKFDLPKTHQSVTTGKDLHKNVTIEFAKHTLLK